MARFLAPVLATAALSFGTLAEAQSFPVTLTHQFGETSIPAQPLRVVSVGLHEQDFLYALGVAPVGVHEWWGEYPYATWPWAEASRIAVGAEPDVLMSWEINFEWVAALQPDLIVATYHGDMDRATYDLLSAIAPTITAPPGFPAWGAPWQEELRLLGQATGTAAKAEEIVADVEGQLAAARAAYPMLEGKEAAVVYNQEGVIRTYNSADTAHRFLQSLGLVIPPVYDEMVEERGHFDISTENMEMIEIDAVIWADVPGSIGDLSVYQNTNLVKEGRAITLGGGVPEGALSFQSPQALEYLIGAIPPMLAAAVDGDPATVASVVEQ